MKKSLLFSAIVLLLFSCQVNEGSKTIKEKDKANVTLALQQEEVPYESQIVDEIVLFKNVLDDQNVQQLADCLDSPKRIEEIELVTKHNQLVNAIQASSNRLSSDVMKDNYDLVYNDLDLNLVHTLLTNVSKPDLATTSHADVLFKEGDCEYQGAVSIKDQEVKINIRAVDAEAGCKKDQQWKFLSNGEHLVLDRRYYL